jgi:hypothetical protein
VNAETILNAAISVLKQKGRHLGDYECDGKVCVLGAMGVAAGFTPDYWSEVEDADLDDLEPVDDVLLDAGRLLVHVIDPDRADLDNLHPASVIDLVGRWHDGPTERVADQVRFLDPPSDTAVFKALAEAARLAEQATS